LRFVVIINKETTYLLTYCSYPQRDGQVQLTWVAIPVLCCCMKSPSSPACSLEITPWAYAFGITGEGVS